jgi:hypothetical protein
LQLKVLEADEGVSDLQHGGNAHMRPQGLEAVDFGTEGVRGTLLEKTSSQR